MTEPSGIGEDTGRDVGGRRGGCGCGIAVVIVLALAGAGAVWMLAPGEPGGADTTIPRHACGGRWVASAGLAWGVSGTEWTTAGGPARNVIVSAAPTPRARVLRDPRRVWRDVVACVRLPADLTAAQRESLRAQLYCHAVWALAPWSRSGGHTWDLEAWRPAVPMRAVTSPRQAVDPRLRCNWGPDRGPAM